MTVIEAAGSGRKSEIPSSWEEMTARQVRSTFSLYSRCIRKGMSPLEFSVRELYMLLGMRMRRLDMAGLGAENVWTLCDRCLGFLFGGEGTALSYSSVSNPLPSVRVGLRRLSGPSDLLSDLSFGEFRHATAAFSSFFRSGKESDLHEALACLYRRKSGKVNRAGRDVMPLSPEGMGSAMRLAGRMKPWQKSLVTLWFSACVKYLQTGKVVIDGETVDMSLLFSGGGDSPSFGWGDLLVEVAKEGGLGTMEQVDEQPLFTVFGIMWHNYKESKRHEQSVRNHKR